MIAYPKNRYFTIFAIFIMFYTFTLANLYIMQIKRSHFFSSLAKHQHNVTITKPAKRGIIYDRNNINPIALNKESFAAFITPMDLKESEKTKDFLKINFPQAYKSFNKNINKHFMYIKRRLNKEELNLIKSLESEDIKLLKETSRYYPIKSLGSIIGITNIDNQGAFGIEQQYDKFLSGTPTTYALEKDARLGHFYFKKQTKVQGTNGKNITLTIDSDLQFLVAEDLKECVDRLNAKGGSVVVLNPTNGDILAMANYPTFDPNETNNLDINLTKNTAATNAYELGSVIKLFLALAALEEEIVTPETIIDCKNTRSTKLNKTKVNTWKAHDKISFSEVIQYSNNIGTAQIALELKEKLYEHYKKLGFGKKINIFTGENSGLLSHPKNWSLASLISLSFGYEISATLLQLAQALTVIANNGYLVKPRINLAIPINKTQKLYKTKSIQQIREILRETITKGTARKANINGYNIMGKTGTANLLEDGTYNPNKNIFTFAGILENGDYKRIIITFINQVEKKNTYASQVAAPLFEKIANRLIIHDKIIK